MVLNPQNCGSREDTLPYCLQNIVVVDKAASFAGAAQAASPFSIYLSSRICGYAR